MERVKKYSIFIWNFCLKCDIHTLPSDSESFAQPTAIAFQQTDEPDYERVQCELATRAL